MKLRARVNGEWREDDVPPRLLLVHWLRENLALTGTHIGCETSICGACTVHLDGRAVKSCTLFAVQADGREVATIEGLAGGEALHPVQVGFWEEHGLQCGYCTPGMIMSSAALLARQPKPTDEEIRHALEGNVCRCTGYQQIVDAVQHAARILRGEAPAQGGGAAAQRAARERSSMAPGTAGSAPGAAAPAGGAR
jgi:carbon-monoxide dehydrogenase small subunit